MDKESFSKRLLVKQGYSEKAAEEISRWFGSSRTRQHPIAEKETLLAVD